MDAFFNAKIIMKKIILSLLLPLYYSISFCQVTISPSNTNLQYSGRIDFTNTNTPRLYYGGSSITTKFTGTSLKAKFSDENWGGANYIGFSIDGGTEIIKSVSNGSSGVTVDVASGLSSGTHTLTFWKRSGQPDGYLQFEGLILANGASVSAPAAKPTRRIELFGDSVTEGVNADNTVDNEGGASKVNAWKSYGMVMARRLNAECHNVGISGLAVANGTGSFNSHVGGIGLETTYNKTSCNDGRQTSWDFTKYTPHLVIMAMGINDNNSVTASNKETWKTKYKTIINDLRNNKYPNADFILTVPPLGQQYTNMATYLNEIVTELNDPDVHYFDITVTAPASHPYESVHQAIANQLYDYVNTLDINWGVNVPVTGVTVSPQTVSVAANGTTQLTATIAPSNATNKNLNWSSSNTSVATVSSTGLVSGVAIGSATITATTVDGSKTATCSVTVTAAVAVASCGLIENFGFESGDFTKWNNSSGLSAILTNSTASNVKSGTKAAVINGSGGLNYATNITVTAGYKLDYSVWAKIEGSPTNTQVGIDYINASGTKISNDIFLITATTYTKYSFSKIPPAGTVKVLVWTYKGSSTGKMYLDDFCLTQSNACGLLSNNSFEGDFTGWANTNSVASIGNSSQSNSGNKSAILNNQGGLNRSANIAVTAGNKVNYEVFAKIEGSPSNPQVGIDYLNASGTKLGNKILNITTTAYTKYSSSEVPPSGTTQVLIWSYKNSSTGKLYMDDFCLTSTSAAREAFEVSPDLSENIKIYPNPTSDILRVPVLDISEKSMDVELFDMKGISIINKSFETSENQSFVEMNISRLQTGTYIVRARQGLKQSNQKMMKE
jgi:uncharacterized protein YjdB